MIWKSFSFPRVLAFALAVAVTASVAKADNPHTLNGTGGSVFNYGVDFTANTISLSGSAFDFNSARFMNAMAGDSTPPSIASFASFSAIPQTMAIDPGATAVWVAITKSGALIAGPYLIEDEVQHKVTFVIPANETQGLIRYWFFQGENLVGEHVSQPGDPQVIKQLVGLTSNEKVVMKEVQYQEEWEEDPLNPGRYINTGATVGSIREVSSGVPTVGGSTGTTPASPGPTPPPVVKTTPTPAPTAPTPTPTPTAPTPTPTKPRDPPTPPPFVPSGTGGATKEDIERAANATTIALNAVADEVSGTGNTIVTAINNANTKNVEGAASVVTAVNTAGAKAHETASAQLTAANKAQGSLDRINATLSGLASSTQAVNSRLASIYSAVADGPEQTPASFPSTFSGTLAATDATPITALIGKLPAVPNVLPSDIGSSSHFIFTLKFPPLTQTFTVDVDMAPYATPIGILRGVMKALLAILFFFLVVNTIKKAVS